MTERVHMRVTKDGAKANYELIVDGIKVADLDWIDVLTAAVQFVSSLRWGERQ